MASKKAIKLKRLEQDPIETKEGASAKKLKASPIASKEAIMDKLARTPIIMNFVKSKDGCWNHQDWLSLLSDLKTKGYDPVDPEQVGLLLEERKAHYLASKNA